MIYTNRETVEKPNILSSESVAKEFERMRKYHSGQDKKSKYKRYRFKANFYNHKEVKTSLRTLFHNKCAYCESTLSATSFGDIDQFRPIKGAMNLDGSFDPFHYWWLAYEWANLYLSCQICNQRYKRNNFPVEDNRRTEIMGDLSVEVPLLIDPCSQKDFLVEHINYEREYAVPKTEKGEHTIKILGLNREELLQSRKKELDRMEVASKMDSKEMVLELIDKGSPYLSCKWANYWRICLDALGGQFPEYLPFFDSFSVEIPPDQLAQPTTETIFRKKQSRKSYSLDNMTQDARNTYFGESRWITKVRVKNFKIIDDLKLEFSVGDASKSKDLKEPWIALLGENGTGKSTVLQAITLTLCGEERLNELNLDARKFVNRDSDEGHGWVKVYLNDRKIPITLKFSNDSPEFTLTPKAPQLIVRSYGSTRLFSKYSDDDQNRDYLFVKNLFDPLTLLLNGNKWLSEKIEDKELFPEIAKSLSELLSLGENQYFYPDQDDEGNAIVSLKLYPDKKGIPLNDLSAGYKAMLALGLDIMMGFGQIWPSIFNAQGIVMIDEIGVHLHPRWKMRIVTALRETFPGINFVIATHEPLCLRGLEKGEVILMRLDGQKHIEIISDLPSPKTMRVGQLLTSVFGLYTTMDPETEKLYSEYYHLQNIRKRTPDEVERFEELKEILKDDLKQDPVTGRERIDVLLGEDMTEMLGFGVIRQKIADYKTGKTKPNLKDLKEDTLKEVQALWKS